MVRLFLATFAAMAVIALAPVRSEAAAPPSAAIVADQTARFMPVYYVRHGHYHGYHGYRGYHAGYGHRYGYHRPYHYGYYHRPYYRYGYYHPYYRHAYYGGYGCYWTSHRVWTAYGWQWRRVRVCH